MDKKHGLPLSLVVLCLAIYLITLGGKFHSIDEDLYLRMTHSLARKGSFAITPIEYAPGFSTVRGLDGQFYANRGPGWPIASLPFFRLGDALTSFGPGYTEPSRDGIADPTVFTLAVTLGNTLIVTLTVALLYASLTRLGYRDRTAAAVSLLFGLGTMAWPYASKSYFGEPLLMLCTLGSFYFALRFRLDAEAHQRPNYAFLGLCCFCLGYAILTKVTAIALLPFLAWYLLSASLKAQLDRRRLALAALFFGAVGLCFIGVLIWYNVARFGSPFKTGYEIEGFGTESLLIGDPVGLLIGLYGLLLSPGKGLLFHALPIVAAIAGIGRIWSSRRQETVFILGVCATTVLGVALWRDWSGGWCWGPRLILNVLPLLMIPAAAAVEAWSVSHRSWQRRIWLALLALGFASQLVGVLPDYLAWYLRVGRYDLIYYNPWYAPFRGHLEAIMRGEIDLFWMKTDIFFPGAGQFMGALLVLLLAVVVATAVGLVRYWNQSARKEVFVDERANSVVKRPPSY